MKIIHRALAILGMATVALVLCAIGLLWGVRQALKPEAGGWATTLHLGPMEIEASVPSLIWIGTTPWVGALLDGYSIQTRLGPVHVDWDDKRKWLAMQCKPCRVPAHSLGAETLLLDAVGLTVRRQGSQLEGQLSTGKLIAPWRGRLTPDAMRVQLELADTPIRDGYELFAQAIPEWQSASIEGTFGLRASVTLPSGEFSFKPHLAGFTVNGLGTEAFRSARSNCAAGLRRSRMRTDSVLARAVIAAEDQRFYEHSGYDLSELTESLQRNQHEGRIERGASTLSQQLARLLVTGGERTPIRKLRELLYAVEMEQTLGKARILRLYLDHAPWGDGICGADAAANRYFGVRAQELDATQAIWLAAMLHHPSAEAQSWDATGQINLPRAQWVANSLRPMPRAEREALAEALSQAAWSASPPAGRGSSQMP